MTMRPGDRHALIATRCPTATKARFAALAAGRGMSESALLTLLVDTVLRDNAAAAGHEPLARLASGPADRITLRLRAGDRRRIEARAALRRLSLSRYVVSLVRAHVREAPPLPMAELDALKAAANALSAVHRTLIELGHAIDRSSPDDAAITACLRELLARIEAVRQAVGDLVRANLISWEADDA